MKNWTIFLLQFAMLGYFFKALNLPSPFVLALGVIVLPIMSAAVAGFIYEFVRRILERPLAYLRAFPQMPEPRS